MSNVESRPTRLAQAAPRSSAPSSDREAARIPPKYLSHDIGLAPRSLFHQSQLNPRRHNARIVDVLAYFRLCVLTDAIEIPEPSFGVATSPILGHLIKERTE